MLDLGPNADLLHRDDARERLVTPALVLDLRAFERNLDLMASSAASRGLRLRPHAKTHKCSEIARRQIKAGALGVSCTVLREAEVMAASGITGIVLTSPVVTEGAIDRLIALLRHHPGSVSVVVDDPRNAEALSAAATVLDQPLGTFVDFSSGYCRTGTASEADAVALAQTLATLPHLKLEGLQAYAGNIQHIEDRADRSERAGQLRAAVSRIVMAVRERGLDVPIVTGAGTGTHDLDGNPFTELQPGSYLFGDAQYAPVLANGVAEAPFETALFLQTAVVSTQAPDYVTVDAGVKSLATDGPLPLVARGAAANATYAFFGDEHGKVFSTTSARPKLGARLELVTPHCDPTVNLHDAIHVFEGDRLVAIWRIDARGH